MKAFFDFLNKVNAKYVDLRFTDIHGAWHHLTVPISIVDENLLNDGIYFDGSSIQGWTKINKSDMIAKPSINDSLSTVMLDPFTEQTTVIVICDVWNPITNAPYEKDPRTIASNAINYLNNSGVADLAFFGPEAEFFLFDGIAFHNNYVSSSYEIISNEFPKNNYYTAEGSHGYRQNSKGGYFPVQPTDAMYDMRCEMCDHMEQMGITIEKHHHEVAPAQQEIGIKRSELIAAGDQIQIYKYVVKNVAIKHGKTATFMPKPIFKDNGSGMHVHQSLWKGNTPLFAGDKYSGLSETALHYIGGILHHARSLNAFANPTTNSYRRLVPGFEAPVICAYSAQNRSAACRIPLGESAASKRIEVRFPDPTANPYFLFSAMLMAGLDGIKNKINPGEPSHVDLFENKQEASKYQTMCGSLSESLEALEHDNSYLTEGGVFTNDLLNSYLSLKWEEAKAISQYPHPWEFVQYYTR